MKSYPKYKPSAAEWLGDVPIHWEVKRAQSIFEERNEKNFPSERMLAATQHKGVIPKEDLEFRTVTAFKNLEQFKLVCANDFVISLRSFEGGFEHSEYRGIISPAYFVFSDRDKNNSPAYWRFLFKSYRFLSLLRTLVVGIRDGQTIRFNDFKENFLPLPPPPEQIIIADFLDEKTKQIDTLIENKQKLIELLKEERQAVINDAVTKGINPKAKMKASHIQELGEIPEHWETRKLSRVAQILSGYSPEQCISEARDKSIPYFKVDNINKDRDEVDTPTEFTSSQFVVSNGPCILFPKRGAAISLNKVGIVHFPFSMDTNLMGLSVQKDILELRFLFYFLKSYSLINIADTSTIPQINNKHVAPLSIPYPPLLEQKDIVRYLDKKTGTIEEVSLRTETEIELLREYRTALITEVVTGKVNIIP